MLMGSQLVSETHAPSVDVSTFLKEWALVCIDLIHDGARRGVVGPAVKRHIMQEAMNSCSFPKYHGKGAVADNLSSGPGPSWAASPRYPPSLTVFFLFPPLSSSVIMLT
ncbi:Hypothetical predicted protein [Prunus dulcis]|uniref:Uncharacterized protein n=1 Tax=Prunus dulcis TaxID=3755 RepID=A0A5E4E339_PRUDU|nr:Hypothetical predicted protein [Prunus dulcis]